MKDIINRFLLGVENLVAEIQLCLFVVRGDYL